MAQCLAESTTNHLHLSLVSLLSCFMLTQMMADEFNLLWWEIQNYIAEADADQMQEADLNSEKSE